MNISWSRRISNKAKGRLRWSHKIEGMLGQTNKTITDLEEILLGNLDLLLLRWLALCFESLCTKSWKKKLRVDHTLNSQIRWEETP